MSQITEEIVLKALSKVQYPDLNQDIVRLGFVKEIVLTESALGFTVALPVPAHPLRDELEQQCRKALESLEIASINITMATEVPAAPVAGKKPIKGISNVIAIASGKGGVGKSTLAVNLALALSQKGARVGLMDCDFYGPSIPSMVGLHGKVKTDGEKKILPHQMFGIKLMSMGFLVERNEPVSWRGPMLHKMLNQFLFNVSWGELDYLLLDLPPGTGDVQLSLTQATPLSGAVLVTTPQEVALRDVAKGLAMFRTVNVPVLGVIENMSYYICGSCDKKHFIFQKGGGKTIAKSNRLPFLGEIPLDPKVPSELGRGEPLLVRIPDSPSAEAIRLAAEGTAIELSKISGDWAMPGPNAMEV